jgi:hypothetical protein
MTIGVAPRFEMPVLHAFRCDVVSRRAAILRARTQMSARRHILTRQVNEPIRLLAPCLEESYGSRIIAALGHVDELAANAIHLADIAPHKKRNIGGQIPHIIRRKIFQQKSSFWLSSAT